jgi:hypothetical protein
MKVPSTPYSEAFMNAVMTLDDLLEQSAQDLDTLFAGGEPGPIPDGEAEGRAIIAPGTALSKPLAQFIEYFTWQGKVFDANHGYLRNKILPFGIKAIIAEVYAGKSWFDQRDCIVLDYSKTSFVAKWIRDEIRRIAPGLYLGIVYWSDAKLIHFALKFPDAAPGV